MLSSSRKLTAAGLAIIGLAVASAANTAGAAQRQITSGDDCQRHVQRLAKEARQHANAGYPDVDRLLDQARAHCDAGDFRSARTVLTEIRFELSQPQKRGS